MLADLAGGSWPEMARRAAAGLTASAQGNNPIGSEGRSRQREVAEVDVCASVRETKSTQYKKPDGMTGRKKAQKSQKRPTGKLVILLLINLGCWLAGRPRKPMFPTEDGSRGVLLPSPIIQPFKAIAQVGVSSLH